MHVSLTVLITSTYLTLASADDAFCEHCPFYANVLKQMPDVTAVAKKKAVVALACSSFNLTEESFAYCKNKLTANFHGFTSGKGGVDIRELWEFRVGS